MRRPIQALSVVVLWALTHAAPQASRYDQLANLPFSENRPTPETAKTLNDELLFQRPRNPSKRHKIIVCTGGRSRKLPVAGGELTATHSDAWSLTSVPPSMLVIGAGATGARVASIFSAFGSQVHLYEASPHILPTEDEDVSSAVAQAFRDSGIDVHEHFGAIEGFQKTSAGIRML